MNRKRAKTKVIDSDQHSRTNASNPSTITKLIDKFKDMIEARSKPLINTPVVPSKLMPPIKPTYTAMGDALDMCPHEVRVIMEHEFNSDNELVVELLKKYITAVKLSGEVDLVPIRKELRQIEQTFQERMNQWHDTVKKIANANSDRDITLRDAEIEFSQAWSHIAVDLIQKIQANPDIDSLGRWDKWMVHAILKTDKKNGTITAGQVKLNFTELKKMSPEEIVALPELADRLRDKDEVQKKYDWLRKAPVSELTKALWESQSSKETSLLSDVIAARKGLIPQRDRWGNIDWRVINPNGRCRSVWDNSDNDYEGLSDEEIRSIGVWSEKQVTDDVIAHLYSNFRDNHPL